MYMGAKNGQKKVFQSFQDTEIIARHEKASRQTFPKGKPKTSKYPTKNI